MNIFPAIDLYDGKVVRLYKGNYKEMTVYDSDPLRVAQKFAAEGAEYLHMVDLMGAKEGRTCDFDMVGQIAAKTDLHIEIGGGIRDEDTIKRYIDAGVERVILGTAAVSKPDFLKQMTEKFSDYIAVGIDIRDNMVAINGWTECSGVTCDQMFSLISELGISRVICTDISKDGAMKGTNRSLYASLLEKYPVNIVASGGVSSLEDIAALKEMGLFGAIIGRAYYTGAISLSEAIRIGNL